MPSSNDDLPIVVVNNDSSNNNNNEEMKQMLEEYEKECQIRKSRAEKFGIEYKQPKQDDVLPWSKLKRLRTEQQQQQQQQQSSSSNVEQQQQKKFVSGINILDPTEIAKMEARKARFGSTSTPPTTTTAATAAAVVDNNDQQVTGDDDNNDDEGREEEEGKDQYKINNNKDVVAITNDHLLPVIQAWDKEEMVRPYRNDPPRSLWQDPSSSKTQQQEEEEEGRDPNKSFAIQPREDPTWIKDKIHLFAIDWAAFKQIRNKDLMAYFSGYGPTYIEWLGDLSCNVCFEDMHTATRALMRLSQEIPPPPPPTNASTTKKESGNGKYSDNDGSSSDEQQQQQQQQTSVELRPDFGNMNWRFCMKPIRKVANDKYGRKNTIARVLMRMALSTDTLDERPNSWPAPPGGFSSTKVLGPESDLRKEQQQHEQGRQSRSNGKNRRNNNKKRQRGRGGEKQMKSSSKDDNESSSYTGAGEHPLLGRGLTSGRGGGFSIEELEKERAAKRVKRTETGES